MLACYRFLRITSRPLLHPSRAFSVSACSRQQIHDADEATLNSHLSNTHNKIIIVDVYEDWCSPCKMLTPLLERIEGEPSLIGARPLDLVTVKGDNAPDLVRRYKVRMIPTVFAFRNGTMLGQFSGALNIPQIKSWFDTLPK